MCYFLIESDKDEATILLFSNDLHWKREAEAANSRKTKGSYKVSTPRNSNTKKNVMKSRSTYLHTKNKIGVKNNHNIPCMISGLEFFSTCTQPIEGAGRLMA